MDFLDFSHIELTEEFIAHVLYGEEGNYDKGGHLYGVGRENKTEFPPDWLPEQIVLALRLVLAKPQVVEFYGDRLFLKRIVANVDIQIQLKTKVNGLLLFRYRVLEWCETC